MQISEIAKKKTPLIRSLCRAKQSLDYAAIARGFYLVQSNMTAVADIAWFLVTAPYDLVRVGEAIASL